MATKKVQPVKPQTTTTRAPKKVTPKKKEATQDAMLLDSIEKAGATYEKLQTAKQKVKDLEAQLKTEDGLIKDAMALAPLGDPVTLQSDNYYAKGSKGKDVAEVDVSGLFQFLNKSDPELLARIVSFGLKDVRDAVPGGDNFISTTTTTARIIKYQRKA